MKHKKAALQRSSDRCDACRTAVHTVLNTVLPDPTPIIKIDVTVNTYTRALEEFSSEVTELMKATLDIERDDLVYIEWRRGANVLPARVKSNWDRTQLDIVNVNMISKEAEYTETSLLAQAYRRRCRPPETRATSPTGTPRRRRSRSPQSSFKTVRTTFPTFAGGEKYGRRNYSNFVSRITIQLLRVEGLTDEERGITLLQMCLTGEALKKCKNENSATKIMEIGRELW